MKKKYNILTILLVCMFSIFAFTGCGDKPTDPTTPSTPTAPVYNTVTFVTNGGSAVNDKSCEIIEVSPTTIRTGFNFKGWFFDNSLTSIVTFPLSVDSDMTLYAKWEKTKEQTIADCMAYIDSQPNDRLFSQEDDSEENKVDITNTIVTHIGDNFNLTWERGRGDLTESNNLITNEYELTLSFDYGDIESATGYFDYIYEFRTSTDDLWAGLVASYRITSITITGDSYLLNGYFTIFNVVGNYNNTEEEVKNSLQSNFNLAKYDFQFLFPVEYWNTIFDFES